MTAILLGDFLLSKSFETIASIDTRYATVISQALSYSNQGYVLLKTKIENRHNSFSINDYVELSYLKNKYSFELFLHLGGLLRKAKTSEIHDLKEFGKHFGTAYFIIEDTIKYLEKMKHAEFPATNIFYAGDEELSLMNVLSSNHPNGEIDDNAKSCFGTAKVEMDKAISKINSLSDLTLKSSLINISKFVLQKTKAFL